MYGEIGNAYGILFGKSDGRESACDILASMGEYWKRTEVK
jgi:hypothetical protein